MVYELTTFERDVLKWLSEQDARATRHAQNSKEPGPDTKLSMQEFLTQRNYSDYFRDYYLVPVVCAASLSFVSFVYRCMDVFL
jgi:predicted NAD/FAD-binding protein